MLSLSRLGGALLIALFGAAPALGQDLRGIPDSPAQRDFDYWIGTWYRETDGQVDTAHAFLVSRLPSGAILEQWRARPDSVRMIASAIRSFDKAWNRWMYVWTSTDGHCQVWEGRRVDGRWYIYREFEIAGDRYLSRQAWLSESADRLVRISEKSYDGGVTWQLRFRESYVRRP